MRKLIYQIIKGRTKVVNLDSMSSSDELLSALSPHAYLLNACFERENSPVRLTIFKKFIIHLWSMKKCHGSKHVINYLKYCHLAIQKFIAGQPVNSLKELAGPGVYPSLRNGLPKFINLRDRNLIRNDNPQITRFYLTLFGVYRVLDCPKTLKLSTITSPYAGSETILDEISSDITLLTSRFLKTKVLKALKVSNTISFLESSSGLHKKSWTGLRSIAYSLNLSHLREDVNILRSFFLDTKINTLYDFFCSIPTTPVSISGYLCTKDEPAGKVRVFAMVDIWTQNILKPLHTALFAFLKSLPNDGTFNQQLSVKRAVEKVKVSKQSFGYDLSAATDRLPIALQKIIISSIFNNTIANAWGNLLVGREYILKKCIHLDTDTAFSYSVGQPMGALSSWAMLAITHHLIVQWCSFKVHNRIFWNEDYELLGDDIVIFDDKIASKYLDIMKLLGLEINLSKSVVSPNGKVIEFAKNTYLKGHNVSGLPWKASLSQNTLLGRAILANALQEKYNFPMGWLSKLIWTRQQLPLFLFSLLRVRFNDNMSVFIRFMSNYIGKLSRKDILSMSVDKFFNYLKLDKDTHLKNDNFSTSLFIMTQSKPVTMLKRTMDVDKTSHVLSQEIFFYLFPEFNTSYYQECCNIGEIHNLQLMSDIPYNIWLNIYSIICDKAYKFSDNINSYNYSSEENLNDSLDEVTNYTEFTKLVARAISNSSTETAVPRLTTFIRFFNKSRKVDVKF